MNIVKVNLSNNGLSLTNITKYKISFQKHRVTTILRIKIREKVAKFFFPLCILLSRVFKTNHQNHLLNVSTVILTLPMRTVFPSGKEASLRFRQLEISVQRHKSLRPFEATNGH